MFCKGYFCARCHISFKTIAQENLQSIKHKGSVSRMMLTPTPQNPSLSYVYSWRSCLLETRPWWNDRMNLLLNRIENTYYSKLLTRKSTDLHVSEGSHIHIDGWFKHNTKPVNQVKINNMLYKQNLSISDKLICNVTVRDTILYFLFRSHIIKGNEKSHFYTALKN